MESNESEAALAAEQPPAAAVQSNVPGTGTLILRSGFGGVLMGLANLVPGISGGTMLLVSGIYPRFVDAVADVTRFRFRFRSLLVVAVVGLAAGLGILLLAGVLKDMVVNHRWVMYSLFIGLTLGGLPLVWRMARPVNRTVYIYAVGAFVLMAGLALLQVMGVVGSGSSNFVTLLLAGLAGASAMILPGVSGGYILLLMGQYVPILDGIHEFKEALSNRDISAAMGPALSVILPVGIGVLVGVAVISNLVKWLLLKHQQATLGLLTGLLLGSVIGLWPFQQGVAPIVGETVIKGKLVTAENVVDIDPKDWPTEFFSPSAGQVGSSLGLILLGLAITVGVSKIGGDESV
jgi:putative membrane protein